MTFASHCASCGAPLNTAMQCTRACHVTHGLVAPLRDVPALPINWPNDSERIRRLEAAVARLSSEKAALSDQLAESMALQAQATSLVQQLSASREQAIQDIEALPTFRVGKAGGLPEAVSRSAVLSIVRGSAK